MRAVFAEKTKDDRVTVAEGTFERVDAEDGWADLIIIAQVSPFQQFSRNPRLNITCRRSIGAQISKWLLKNLPESSNPKERYPVSGT